MTKAVLFLVASILATQAFAQTKTVELKAGKSVVFCRTDNRDSRPERSGLSDLNRALIENEVQVAVNDIGAYSFTTVIVKSPFSVSSPTISTTKNAQSTGKDFEDTYTYCVTITKQ